MRPTAAASGATRRRGNGNYHRRSRESPPLIVPVVSEAGNCAAAVSEGGGGGGRWAAASCRSSRPLTRARAVRMLHGAVIELEGIGSCALHSKSTIDILKSSDFLREIDFSHPTLGIR